MRIINGHIFDLEKGFVERDLCTEGQLISEHSEDDIVIDAKDCYVIPGLVDVHFHGAIGEDFSDATPEGLQKIADFELSEGVTYICPTGMTLGEDQLTAICKNAAAHRTKETSGAEGESGGLPRRDCAGAGVLVRCVACERMEQAGQEVTLA